MKKSVFFTKTTHIIVLDGIRKTFFLTRILIFPIFVFKSLCYKKQDVWFMILVHTLKEKGKILIDACGRWIPWGRVWNYVYITVDERDHYVLHRFCSVVDTTVWTEFEFFEHFSFFFLLLFWCSQAEFISMEINFLFCRKWFSIKDLPNTIGNYILYIVLKSNTFLILFLANIFVFFFQAGWLWCNCGLHLSNSISFRWLVMRIHFQRSKKKHWL